MRIHSRKRRRRVRLALLVLPVILTAGCWLIQTRLAPIVASIARMQVESIVSGAMNEAIGEQIAKGDLDYDRMIYFEKDLNGSITALKTNMSEVNRLKTEILNRLDQKLNVLETKRLRVALGSVLAPTLFSGRGPGIQVQITAANNSDAVFFSRFQAAGINQTLHQILLKITVDVTVLLPTDSLDTTVSTQVVVAETVLVGAVPQTYLDLNNPMDKEES